MTGPAGFVHLGLLYSDPEELVEAVLPLVRGALDAGDALSTIVDRRTHRALREALEETGHDPEALVSRSPAEVSRTGPEGSVRELRALGGATGPSGRVTALSQHQGYTDPEDLRLWEAACSLVVDDLPMTLLCACSRDADPRAVEAVVEGHPRLLVDGVESGNPRYRRPPDRSPSPAALWGRRSVRLQFGGPEDLGRVRERIARVAGDIGLGADERDAAVLAVHEAALLAVCPQDGSHGSGSCVLEVRTDGRTMLTEVQGPGAGADSPAPMRYVEMFCAASAVRDEPAGRAVRVLSARPPAS